MGKLVTFVTMLVFIDLLFIVTGLSILTDSGTGSLGSIIFNAILNIENAKDLEFFKQIIGDIGLLLTSGTGLLALGATAAISVATFVASSDIIKFVPIAGTLGFLVNDFVVVGVVLISLNVILGTMIMAPIIIIYSLTVLEWLRVKD